MISLLLTLAYGLKQGQVMFPLYECPVIQHCLLKGPFPTALKYHPCYKSMSVYAWVYFWSPQSLPLI